MSLFEWVRFRSTKFGIKVYTQLDVVTQIQVSFNITEAVVHDVNAMDWINYEPFACCIFDLAYWDLDRLYPIEMLNSFFVIREKWRPKFDVVDGENLLEGTDNILSDNTVRFTTRGNAENDPFEIRRIIYYELELNRSICEVMRILGSSLLTKNNIRVLFQPVEAEQSQDDGQLQLEFEVC
jgi:hypothetical protein